jgi:hypothetical protein
LDSLGKCFEGFRKAQIDILPIGIGKSRVKEHVIELLIGNDDAELSLRASEPEPNDNVPRCIVINRATFPWGNLTAAKVEF